MLLEIILDASSPEEIAKRLKVLFLNQEHVELTRLRQVLFEPSVTIVQETCEEHGVLGYDLLIAHLTDDVVLLALNALEQREFVDASLL